MKKARDTISQTEISRKIDVKVERISDWEKQIKWPLYTDDTTTKKKFTTTFDSMCV